MLDAHELGEVGGLPVDVGLEGGTPHQAAVHRVVEADADAVRAQGGELVGGALPHREARVAPRVVQREVGGEGVHPGGLQPGLRPGVQVASGRLLERLEEVGELAVAEGVLLEVGAQAGEELLLADVGDELLERRGALGVGDAVEVDLHRLEVVVVRGDRVGGGQLVLPVGPVLAVVGEPGPRLVVLRGVHGRVVGCPLGERLVEPQVVPPAHGDEVAEPHVRHLVEDRVGTLLVEPASLLAAGEVLVAERDAAGVLHRTVVELGDVELVVLVERVRVAEGVLEELEALLGDLHQLGGVEVGDDRLAAVVTQRDGAVLALVGVQHLVVLAGHDRGDVGRHPLGLREAPDGGAVGGLHRLRGGCVGDDLPVGGRRHGEREHRLEVGLLEGGVDAPRVGHLALGVEVDPVVGGVDEPVQPLAGVAVEHVGGDPQLVVGGQVGQPDPAVRVELAPVQLAAVEHQLGDVRADQVHEGLGARLGAREPERRGGPEGLGAPGREVEVDDVGLHVQEGCASARLVPGEVGTRHGGHLVTRIVEGPNRRQNRRYRYGQPRNGTFHDGRAAGRPTPGRRRPAGLPWPHEHYE